MEEKIKLLEKEWQEKKTQEHPVVTPEDIARGCPHVDGRADNVS